QNTSVGARSLQTMTAGDGNTALGHAAGTTNLTGSENTFVGHGADAASGALTNATAIGHNAVVGVSNALVLGGTGAASVSVGIGTPQPAGPLHINAAASPPNSLPAGNNGLLLGSAGDSTYKWIQSYGGQPLAINPKGNRVGVGITNPTHLIELAGGAYSDGT